MRVFLSWSGERSKAVASALRLWLPGVIQTVRPWMSQVDIGAGERWNREVSDQLGQTRFGIICVTRENCTAPWVLFEAGALAKTVEEAFVCPYLVGLEPADVPPGPLTQFQAKRANEEETWDLVHTINRALTDGALPEEQLRTTFGLWWPRLSQALQEVPAEAEEQEARRSVPDMVAEVLDLVRALTRRGKTSTRGDLMTAWRDRGRLGEEDARLINSLIVAGERAERLGHRPVIVDQPEEGPDERQRDDGEGQG